ncbi:MAG TPA: glycosyl transferase family 2 [Bacteroidales bacterium]|nr:glycosyl transferase family 2 [Bacteroidales bacterium]HBZ22417.1 glycosyl transferase family 2 [Bacteroidales bacterium]
MKTAVVILNWNGLALLQEFLATVVRFSAGPGKAVFMVDNGSTDTSAEWVSKNLSDVAIIRLESNHGFAGGYNRALNQIAAEYYVLLNSDAEVTDGWLEPLINYMDENPDVASCQPKIRSFNDRDHFEYAGAAGGYIDKYGYTFCRGRIFDNVEKDRGQYDNITDIFWSSGACMVVRSTAWKHCGGFDDDFFAHMEEVDLCWRFHLAGYRVSCVPGSVIYHTGGGSLPYDTKPKVYLNFRNNLFLLYKNLPDNKLHKILFIRKLLDGAAALVFIFKGRAGNAGAILKAHLDYYKNIKKLKVKREVVKNLTINKTMRNLVNKSIVFRFYIKGEKTFSTINI